jgi:RNA polymerase sigma-70 factor, ECF subfamily
LHETLSHIIEGVKAQEPRSQEALYLYCYPQMIKVCMRYAFGDRELAGALYNSAMLKVFRKADDFRSEGAFEGWVRTVVVTSCIDACKRNTDFKVVQLEKVPDSEVPFDPAVYDHISGNEVVQLVHRLPKNTGLVFNLYVMEGYSHEEIAAIIGISAGTSRWHLSEARKLLKAQLEKMFTQKTMADVRTK